MGRGRTGRKRTAGAAVAIGATAVAVGLGAAPAGAAAVAQGVPHTFTATSGARVTCQVVVGQSWLDGEAHMYTSVDGPAACVPDEVVVGWRFTDTDGNRHRGREVVEGGRSAVVWFSDVAEGQQVSGHRVEFAGCASNCTFGTYVFEPFGSSK